MSRLLLWGRARNSVESGDASDGSAPDSPKSLAIRKARTEKSRTQKLLNSQAKRLQKKYDQDIHQDVSVRLSTSHDSASRMKYSAHLQHWFFTGSFFQAAKQEDVYNHSGTFANDRARSVHSLVLGLVSLLNIMFRSDRPAESELFHVLNTHIVDDTSTRIRGPNPADGTTVFQVMNVVQAIHLRRTEEMGECPTCCASCRIPLPLLCLDQADTKGIYESFIGCAVVTAKGIGRMLHQFGAQLDIVKAKYKTFVFIGDALKANDSAFREECKQLQIANLPHNFALRLRCMIHQLSLIRKPVVLAIPKLWSTIVRLSHLFEGLSFRKAFAKSLATVISNSFVYLPVCDLPPESTKWRSLSHDLRSSFRCRSKTREQTFGKILDFLNGDLESECVFHYCVDKVGGAGHCCDGANDALGKCLKLLVPFFSRGFPAPLLYRFKHYDEAISYITAGTSIHQLLIRALANMGFGDAMDPKQRVFLEQLLADCDFKSEGLDGTDAVIFHDDAAEGESFQVQNAKRKALVHQEIIQPHFRQNALLVDFLIKPFDGMINRLFKRSARLTKLTLFGKHDPECKADVVKSQEFFIEVVSGQFGWDCIHCFCEMITHGLQPLLQLGSRDQWHGQLQTIFTIFLQIVSDTWRRLVHDHGSFQFKMFSLYGKTLDEFVALWDKFHRAKTFCSECFDEHFSLKLMNLHPGKLSKAPAETQCEVHLAVTTLLQDIATFSPMSSDPVEVKNGQVQSITSRRGNMAVKAPVASRESSFLQAAIRDFELVKHWVEDRTLPSKRTISGIIKRVGVAGMNHHSQEKPSVSCLDHLFLLLLCLGYVSKQHLIIILDIKYFFTMTVAISIKILILKFSDIEEHSKL